MSAASSFSLQGAPIFSHLSHSSLNIDCVSIVRACFLIRIPCDYALDK